jgi:hypothetical protein
MEVVAMKTRQVRHSQIAGICKITVLQRGSRPIVLGTAAAACAALAAAASMASAAPVPPSGGDCPNGYEAVEANKSYYGMAAGGRGADRGAGNSTTVKSPTQDEIIGLACFKRTSPTRGTMQFRWSAVGPLYDGILFYQLYDCTARTIARQHSKALEYPNGSKSATNGHVSAEFVLDPKHKYAARVTGQGAYKRPNPVLAGSIGYFQRFGTSASFFAQSSCQ